MVIAFLDLLGFSHLVETNIEVAYDNLNSFNRAIRTKITDNLTHPISSYEENMHEFVENSSITSFNNMISISDSLIISSENPSLFIRQLSNLVATIYMQHAKPFNKKIHNLSSVKSDTIFDYQLYGTPRPHPAFPILFRGGITYGKDVIFSKEIQIFRDETSVNGTNVCGVSYVRAVELEKTGKGPRLFCDNHFVEQLKEDDDKKAIRRINEDLFEIVWTYYACEATEKSSDIWSNIKKRIEELLLPSAYNLYDYYNRIEKADEYGRKKVAEQYKEFVLLVYRGIMKYAKDHNLDLNRTHKEIISKLDNNICCDICIDDLDSFI